MNLSNHFRNVYWSTGTSSTVTLAVLPSSPAAQHPQVSRRVFHAGGSPAVPLVSPADGGDNNSSTVGTVGIGLPRVADRVWVREPFTAVSGNSLGCHRFLIKNSWDSLTFLCCVLPHLSSCPPLCGKAPEHLQQQGEGEIPAAGKGSREQKIRAKSCSLGQELSRVQRG